MTSVKRLSKKQKERALAFITDNLTRNPSLGQIATATGISTFHFSRLFKASIGMTVMSYVRYQRVEMAVVMLDGSDLSVAAIAMACGFCNPSHLTTVFKQIKGISPIKYRNITRQSA